MTEPRPVGFDEAVAWMIAIEGGDNHGRRADRGGRTKYGITQSTWNVLRARAGRPKTPVADITTADAAWAYHVGFWAPAHCDDLPPWLRIIHFDTLVQRPPAEAVRMLQAAVGADPDGRWGPRTAAAAAAGGEAAYLRYWQARARHYCAEAERHVPQRANFRGWLNRLMALDTFVRGGR